MERGVITMCFKSPARDLCMQVNEKLNNLMCPTQHHIIVITWQQPKCHVRALGFVSDDVRGPRPVGSELLVVLGLGLRPGLDLLRLLSSRHPLNGRQPRCGGQVLLLGGGKPAFRGGPLHHLLCLPLSLLRRRQPRQRQ